MVDKEQNLFRMIPSSSNPELYTGVLIGVILF